MAADARTALFFDIFARDRTGNAFGRIAKSTDTLTGKLARFAKVGAVAAAAGIVAFATQGVRAFLKFDDAMTQSLAIMGQISGPMRAKMETAAREVGKTTRFSADQAAQGYFFLASAGMDAAQSIAAMPQVAKFAQAGMFDLARATDLSTDAQKALGLAVKDPEQNLKNLTRVTDVLVGANTLANASTEQFAEALTGKAGPAMRQAGIEIEAGVAVLGVFADQGRKGEQASSLFAATLEQMQRHAINNRDAFADLNVRVFDANGNMRNMADIVADLEGALGGMSLEQQKAALMQLGFNRTALDGIMALMGMSDQIRTYESDLRGMAGVTDEVAAKQLESFAARLDLLKSRIADFGMSAGRILVNTAFEVGETVGEMSRMFSENLPKSVQTGMLAITGIAAAAPLVIGAWRKIKSAVDTVRISLMLMSTTAKIATISMGGIGLALAAGAAIMAFFARRNLEAKARVDALRESLDRQTGAITDNTREIAAKELQDRGALDAAERLGLNLETVTEAALGNADALAEVKAATSEAANEYRAAIVSGEGVSNAITDAAVAAETLTEALDDQNGTLTEAQREQLQLAAAAGRGEDAQDDLADQIGVTNSVIDDQVDALSDLISELDDMVKQVFDARDAQRDFEQALDDARDAAKENGKTLDITTQKGRDNERQLDRLAQAALKDAAATLEDAEAKGNLGQGFDDVRRKMETARTEFIKIARQMGLSKDEAEKLADELGLIPGNYRAQISTPGSQQAINQVAELRRQIASLPGHTQAGITVGGMRARARGGFTSPGWTLVGEEGPELVRFNQPGHVHPAQETARLLAEAAGRTGGASQPVYSPTIIINGDADRKTLAEARHQQRLAYLEAR